MRSAVICGLVAVLMLSNSTAAAQEVGPVTEAGAAAKAETGPQAEGAQKAEDAQGAGEAQTPEEAQTAGVDQDIGGAEEADLPSETETRAEAGAAPQPSAATSGTACVLGLHSGVDPSDARTAAQLVCERLREHGAPVSGLQQSAQGASSAYRVELRRLGDIILIDLVHEVPVGSPRDSRSMRLSTIEEVVVAAPRLAKALMSGEPMEATAEVDTLVGEETRTYDKVHGEFFFGLGVFGMALPTEEIFTGFGGILKGFYEGPQFGVGVDLKLGGADQRERDAMFFGMSVGGRYFFGTSNISPFVGGGLGFLILRVDRDEDSYDEYYGNGLSGYAETGIEFLRFHSTRLDLSLRIDMPFFTLESDDDYYSYPSSSYYPPGSAPVYRDNNSSRYVFPILLALSYSW